MWCENKPTLLGVLMSLYTAGWGQLSSPIALSVDARVRGRAAGLHAELIRTVRGAWSHAARGAPAVGVGLAHRPPVDVSAGNWGRKKKKVHKSNFSNRNVLQAITFRPFWDVKSLLMYSRAAPQARPLNCVKAGGHKLTTEERLPAIAGVHTQPRFLRCWRGALQAGDESGAGVQVPTDLVLTVNDGRLRRSTAHLSPSLSPLGKGFRR